jgi:predicted transposase YbfD/YdcC
MATARKVDQANGNFRDLSIVTHFARLKDPRRAHRRLHHLQDIVVIALCAVIANADDWQQVEAFGRNRLDWLKRFLVLPNGIPSHDTFERVFDRISPRVFQICFRDWAQAVSSALGIKQVAIDGKTLRGSRSAKLKALHLVSAWATAQHLSLGQVATDDKSNEITAIPQLLELLDLHGALVTIDAMGCQKEIARKIVDQGGDYALTVKANQEHLFEDIHQLFAKAIDNDYAGLKHDTHEQRDQGHGREEYRCCTVLETTQGIRHVNEWANLTVVGMCISERTSDGKTSGDVRYFIGSKRASARHYAQALRNHWSIENNLHWQLDVTFAEDQNRVTRRHGAENLALLRRLTLSLLKIHPAKMSMAKKRYVASLDCDFLEEILRNDGTLDNP